MIRLFRTIVPIEKRDQETPSTVTLRFRYERPARPGQFVMVWIPGDDEIPMSLSYAGNPKGITVKVMGATSRAIQQLRVGDRIGIRGPYGNSFDTSPERILIVGGGSGAAVLAPAAEIAAENGSRVTVALGATTAKELLFEDRFRHMGARVEIATDDGSKGTKGYVTELVGSLLRRETFEAVWTCGPEVMMRKVIDAAAGSGAKVVCSLERVMKCSLGLCDACAIGPYHVCVDGPVFPAERISGLRDFGRFKREPSGRLVPA